MPFPSIGLGRFGRSPARATLAPHLTGVFHHALAPTTNVHFAPILALPTNPLSYRVSGFYPSAGISLITAFDLLRADVSRGLKDGRWMFSFDVSRPFWGIL